HLSPRPVIRHPYVDLYFFFSCYRDPRDLHSFPTRRSSDLPEDDGTYSIPEGNLFEPGQELTRPEIYAMGLRNPFRITVDPETNRSEEHTSELQSRENLVCRLLLEKKKKTRTYTPQDLAEVR